MKHCLIKISFLVLNTIGKIMNKLDYNILKNVCLNYKTSKHNKSILKCNNLIFIIVTELSRTMNFMMVTRIMIRKMMVFLTSDILTLIFHFYYYVNISLNHCHSNEIMLANSLLVVESSARGLPIECQDGFIKLEFY